VTKFSVRTPGGELLAWLPGAVVPGPQGLILSQYMQPPAAPQIVEQRRPDSPVGHLSPLVIAPLDSTANDDSLLLDDYLFALQAHHLVAPHARRDVEQQQRVVALAHEVAGPGLGADDIQ